VKKLSLLIIASLIVSTPTSTAALKQISVKSLTPLITIAPISEVSGVLANGLQLIIFGNREDQAYVRAIDSAGKEQWSAALSPELDSIATAGAVDSAGNIWIAGSASLERVNPTPVDPLVPINPDGVDGTKEAIANNLDAVVLWKIPTGTSIPLTYTNQQESAVLVNAIALDNVGISLVGVRATDKGSSGFLLSADSSGIFTALIKVGSQTTELSSVIRYRDGSKMLIGSSSESLGGKKLIGLADGVIIRVDSQSVVTKVVRSSEIKANRSWSVASSSLLLGGSVIKDSKIQSAVTKFSSSLAPQWTSRFDSTGTTFTSGANRALFASTSTIASLRGWAPKSSRPLLLTFDTKGLISEAYSAPVKHNEVFGLIESKELGLLVLTTNGEVVSAFQAK